MAGTPSPETVCTKQLRVAQLAKQMPEAVLTTLAHHIDVAWLREAHRQVRKDGAAGVDGQTAVEYASNLEDSLRSLLDRAKSGDYRAPPVRRVHIPKGDGSKTRPIGVPTFEDKVLQKAVVMVLEPVYEQAFLPCSYGFRPGRNAHQALRALDGALMEMGGGVVLEADIESFFDSVDRRQLLGVIRRRVRDGVLLRLISKWLHAGVSENGRVYDPETGTPQGGVISPLLANIYLHVVLDEWFEKVVRPHMRGRVCLVRYADDFAIAFELEGDARRVLAVLPKRFGKYGLRLHPDKTRLVSFRRPPRQGTPKRGDARRPETFDLLGFTHYWGRSRRGSWVVKRKTARDRFSRTMRRVATWCRVNRHLPVKEQHLALSQKLRGHDAYYGVTHNWKQLARLRHEVERAWHKWLCRRSCKAYRPWAWMKRLLKRYALPPSRIVHSYVRAASP